MSKHYNAPLDPFVAELCSRFFDAFPESYEMIDTSVGEDDFRNTFIIKGSDGVKRVLKIVSNDFTFPEKIRMWKMTVEEYRKLGYYCPRIYSAGDGVFPTVEYRGRACVVYAEEFSLYRSVEDRMAEGGEESTPKSRDCFEDVWSMTAKIAAEKLSYSEYPSGYCLFESFCPSEPIDEVLSNALDWREAASALPAEFRAQTDRIWDLWERNREELSIVYPNLPSSVFQADLNPTNLLVDGEGRFKGVFDFNLCGRDVFLNYLMRENYGDFDKELCNIRRALRIASRHYDFSEEEKAAALPIYRCVKPLWYNRVYDLKEAGEDPDRIQTVLDSIEYHLTTEFDFRSFMG